MLELIELDSTSESINTLHKRGWLELSSLKVFEGDSGFFLFRNGRQSGLGVVSGDRVIKVDNKGIEFQGITPKDAQQHCLFFGLRNFDLVFVTGQAGTGKTYISLAYALNCLFRREMNIVLLKSTSFVGGSSNAIGAIPGNHREKMEGYIESYLCSMRKILGSVFEHQLYQLEAEGRVMFQPIELVRGMQFDNSIVIIDEAQNLTLHQLVSIISRVGVDSKCIVLGDLDQIDVGLDRQECGLYRAIASHAFVDCDFATGIELKGQYRSPMANFAYKLIKEVS